MNLDPPDLPFWTTARHLLRLWRPERRTVAFAIVCAFGTSGLTIAIAATIQRTIDDAIVPQRADRLPGFVALLLVLAVARFATSASRRVSTSRIGIRSEARVRRMLFAAYLRYPRAFYDLHATGQVLSRATNDLSPIRYFIGWGMVQTIQSAIMIVGVAVVLATVNPVLALLAGVAMPLIALLTWRFAYLIVPISRLAQQKEADVTETADEAVVGIEMVQAFGREDDIRGRFGTRGAAVRDVRLRGARVDGRYLPGLTFLPTLAIAMVLAFGGHLVIRGELTLGQFVLFNTLLLQLVWPLEALGWILNLAQRAVASASRAFAWLDDVEALAEQAPGAALPSGPLGVRFRGVRFAYATSSEVLRGVDLAIAPGEIVAICGSTGSGKSSLLSLVDRFYDPDAGHVELGGVDVRHAGLVELRDAVALVTQRPVLFSAPLRDNLLAGRVDATEEQLLAACEAAGVADFIAQLPDGYATLIGERGVNLSGGQRQRVALARALLARGRVLVLDDPLSAVDTESEQKLIARLRPAVAGRTVLIAAQRLSTVLAADRAVVLDEGRIVEDGTPAALLRAGGAFAALFGDEIVAA